MWVEKTKKKSGSCFIPKNPEVCRDSQPADVWKNYRGHPIWMAFWVTYLLYPHPGRIENKVLWFSTGHKKHNDFTFWYCRIHAKNRRTRIFERNEKVFHQQLFWRRDSYWYSNGKILSGVGVKNHSHPKIYSIFPMQCFDELSQEIIPIPTSMKQSITHGFRTWKNWNPVYTK